MSFEGYYELVCKNGHLITCDCYSVSSDGLKDWECPICSAKLDSERLIDTTNGDAIVVYKPKLNPLGGNRKTERATPRWFIDVLKTKGFDIRLDTCAKNAECAVAVDYYSPAQDGLLRPWLRDGRWNWCNPPFSGSDGGIAGWIRKAIEEANCGARTLMLLPASLGTDWCRQYHGFADSKMLVVPRLNFYCMEKRVLLTGAAFWTMLWEVTPESVAVGEEWDAHTPQMEYLEARKPKGALR